MSEVARLRRLIELECEAMKRAMMGFRVAGSHDIINNQFGGIAEVQEQLAAMVGESESARITVETYIHPDEPACYIFAWVE